MHSPRHKVKRQWGMPRAREAAKRLISHFKLFGGDIEKLVAGLLRSYVEPPPEKEILDGIQKEKPLDETSFRAGIDWATKYFSK